MKQSLKVLFVLLFVMSFAFEASAVVYRKGLRQFTYGCTKEASADITKKADSITDASKLDIVEKTLMASINGTGNINNPVSGKTWKWSDNTTFGYEGELYLEPGTYTCWGRYDDGGAIVINDTVVYTHGAASGYNQSPKSGTYIVGTAGWQQFRGYAWDWSGGKCPIGDAKSAIQIKLNDGDWIIDATGIPMRFDTGADYVSLSGIVPTATPNVFQVKAIVNFPEGIEANVWALASEGNKGYASKANWEVSTAPQTVVGTGAEEELIFEIDVSTLASPYVVVYSENTNTEGLSEAYASNAEWSTEYGYSTIVTTAISAQGNVNVDLVSYTNFTASVRIDSYGTGSDSVEVAFEISKNSDFSDSELVQIGNVSIDTSVSHSFVGLETSTEYFLRAVMTNSAGITSYSKSATILTWTPQPAELIIEKAKIEYSSFDVSVTMSTYGEGSTYSSLELQVSDKEDFSNIVVDTSTDDAIGIASAKLSTKYPFFVNKDDNGVALVGNSTYYVRAVAVNEWNVTSYSDVVTIELDDTIIVYNGYGFNNLDNGLEIYANVSYIVPGLKYDAALSINGVEVKTWTSLEGLNVLSYQIPDIDLRPSNSAILTFTVYANEGTFTYNLEGTFSNNQEALKLISAISELDNNDNGYTVAKIGDRFLLPEVTFENDGYTAGDVRVAKLLEDGRTVEIIGYGFTKIAKRVVDPVAGTMTAERGLVVVPPLAVGEGNVYLCIANKANKSWAKNQPQVWVNLTDPEAGGYPSKKDDVAMVYMYGTQSFFVEEDVTVGQIWFACENGTFYFRGPSKASAKSTIYFERSDSEMPLVRLSGLEQTDGTVLPSSLPEFQFRCINKANLVFDCSNDLLFDLGFPVDPVSKSEFRNMNRSRVEFHEGIIIDIPEGKKCVVDGTNAGSMTGDSQRGNAICKMTECTIIGKGILDYNGPGNLLFTPYVSDFEGLFDFTMMTAYDSFGIQNRGGGLYQVFWDGRQPVNAKQRIEGHIGLGSSNYSVTWEDSFGVLNGGSAHGYGSYGPVPNHFAPKAFIAAGGGSSHFVQSNDSWINQGVYESIWASDKLIVENGVTYFSVSGTTANNRATNTLAFAEIENPNNKGLIFVSSSQIQLSYDASNIDATTGLSKYRNKVAISNFNEVAIGAGTAENPSVIPYVANKIGNDYYFALADQFGTLKATGYHKEGNLKDFAATTDFANAVCFGKNSLALDNDAKVNSLVLRNIRDSRSLLGEGNTLTITSGGLIFTQEYSLIDSEEAYNAGTQGNIVFPNRAFITAGCKSSSKSGSEIWSTIFAPKGMTIGYPGVLLLGGDQTGIDEEIHVANSNLILGKNTTPTTIDVPVSLYSGKSSLTIAVPGSLSKQIVYCESATRQVPQINVAFDGVELCKKLYVDGVNLERGTYGATGSGAEFINDRMFTGPGVLKVISDDLIRPTTIIIR